MLIDDPVSTAFASLLKHNGYAIDVARQGETFRVTVTHEMAASETAEASDVCAALCCVAERVGIELDDE